MREKIVLVGAGGRGFAEAIVADLIRMGWACELALVDTDPAALAVIHRLTAKMLAERPAPIVIAATTDRRAALPGATTVIVTINVGGRRAWERDVLVPRRHGIFAPVGDTVGPGGASRALRMIPAVVAIARDVADLAPDALFVNYANPMAPICRAVLREVGLPVVGLCHGIFGDGVRHLARALGVPPHDVQYTAVGYNHLTWFTDLRLGGEDLRPRLREIADERVVRARAAAAGPGGAEPADSPFCWEVFRTVGLFPCVLDRHVTEFFPQFFRDGRYFGRTLGVDAFSFEETIASGDREAAEMRRRAGDDAPLGDDYFARLDSEHELVMDIVDAIRRDRRIVFDANLPNTGQAPGLPPGAIVEGPAIAGAGGLRPIAQPPLPPAVLGMLAPRYHWAEVLVDAALSGRRDGFAQALALDGACSSMAEAEALAADLLAAQAPFLPRFAA